MKLSKTLVAGLAFCSVFATTAASAQTYPARPVKIIGAALTRVSAI